MQLCYHLSVVALLLVILASSLPFLVSAQTNQPTYFVLPQNQAQTCAYWWGTLNLAGGEGVNVQWSTHSQIPVAVGLYITTLSAARARWYCDIGPESLFYDSGAFGSMPWVAPTSGTYALLVVNDGPFTVSGAVASTNGNVTILFSLTGYGAARQEPFCPVNPIHFPQC